MNVRCPSCGAEQPESARFCNACGTTLSPPAAVPPAKSRNQTTGLVIVLGAIGIIAAVILARSVFPSLSIWQPPPTATPLPDVGTAEGAWDVCQSFVRQRMNQPPRATFASLQDSEVTRSADQHMNVVSHVDLANGVGTPLRTIFSCEVRYTGHQKWSLVSLDLL